MSTKFLASTYNQKPPSSFQGSKLLKQEPKTRPYSKCLLSTCSEGALNSPHPGLASFQLFQTSPGQRGKVAAVNYDIMDGPMDTHCTGISGGDPRPPSPGTRAASNSSPPNLRQGVCPIFKSIVAAPVKLPSLQSLGDSGRGRGRGQETERGKGRGTGRGRGRGRGTESGKGRGVGRGSHLQLLGELSVERGVTSHPQPVGRGISSRPQPSTDQRIMEQSLDTQSSSRDGHKSPANSPDSSLDRPDISNGSDSAIETEGKDISLSSSSSSSSINSKLNTRNSSLPEPPKLPSQKALGDPLLNAGSSQLDSSVSSMSASSRISGAGRGLLRQSLFPIPLSPSEIPGAEPKASPQNSLLNSGSIQLDSCVSNMSASSGGLLHQSTPVSPMFPYSPKPNTDSWLIPGAEPSPQSALGDSGSIQSDNCVSSTSASSQVSGAGRGLLRQSLFPTPLSELSPQNALLDSGSIQLGSCISSMSASSGISRGLLIPGTEPELSSQSTLGDLPLTPESPLLSSRVLQPSSKVCGVGRGLLRWFPAPDRQSPAPGKKSPAPDTQFPSSDRRSPAPDKQSPSPDKKSPAPDRQFPSPEKQSSTLNRRSPAPDKQSPSPDRFSTLPNGQSPSPNRHSPLPDSKRSPTPNRRSPSPDKQSSTPNRQSPSPDRHSPAPSPAPNRCAIHDSALSPDRTPVVLGDRATAMTNPGSALSTPPSSTKKKRNINIAAVFPSQSPAAVLTPSQNSQSPAAVTPLHNPAQHLTQLQSPATFPAARPKPAAMWPEPPASRPTWLEPPATLPEPPAAWPKPPAAWPEPPATLPEPPAARPEPLSEGAAALLPAQPRTVPSAFSGSEDESSSPSLLGGRSRDEVEQRVAALQRSIHCREVELKRVQSKNEAMTKELASEFLEMRKEDEEIDPSCFLQPDRIKAFDDLLRLNARAVIAAERVKRSEEVREDFKKKSYVKLGSNKLAKMELGLVLSEDDWKEKVKAAKARTNLLQGKLDFYVNNNL